MIFFIFLIIFPKLLHNFFIILDDLIQHLPKFFKNFFFRVKPIQSSTNFTPKIKHFNFRIRIYFKPITQPFFILTIHLVKLHILQLLTVNLLVKLVDNRFEISAVPTPWCEKLNYLYAVFILHCWLKSFWRQKGWVVLLEPLETFWEIDK